MTSDHKGFFTLKDLALIFGTTKIAIMLPGLEKEGFPAPLPYRTRQKRWNADAVLRWKNRHELKHRAILPENIGGRP